MTKLEQELIIVKLDAITQVAELLGDQICTNTVGGAVTAIKTIVDSIQCVVNESEASHSEQLT